ncbi:sperm surface protein Sp17 [Monodelphis domestica]|uniref:Sperm surface protein Sp17 n=1 Tax=Monodelphis domestica TaxID=13616 RepID=SP17_MONDO|nr:sperm surface protein Sp17 [Monodelphis domestica]O62771.1 RecName: Full=Sperm surface protein Sp17; AltName: Full=Sperm autoantigenic protein 17 [Monodelphis domestica]AAC08025.1 sperm protein Sp17 [Monodelphis domestica]
MSIPFSNTHYRIPQGFGNLLEGLTREILREQPDNIPAFAAAYFENLLEKREKTNFDPAEWGAKVDDRFYNNHAFKDEPPEKSETQKIQPEKVAIEKETMPQETVKEKETQVSFVEEPTEEPQKEEEEEEDEEDLEGLLVREGMQDAAVKIQAVFRGHKTRKEYLKKRDSTDETADENNE